MLREKPIIMSTAMAAAIVAGSKTQTRRRVNIDQHMEGKCPYGRIGDRLWVREAWCAGRGLAYAASRELLMSPGGAALKPGILYKADGGKVPPGDRWLSPTIMPRHFTRTLLELTGTRVERLQDISEEDARAEGVVPYTTNTLRMADPFAHGPLYRPAFADLWADIYGDGAWNENPLVWVLTFKLLTPEVSNG